MKRIITAVIALVFAISSVSALGTAASAEELLPRTEYSAAVAAEIAEKSADDMNYAGFCGRLSVPAVGINVAMYNSLDQGVCDRVDSACCFNLAPYSGYLIADHSNQDFSVLPQVTVGTIGGIVLANGDVTFIECEEVFQGHNTGSIITDGDYNVAVGQYDYLTYTCLNCWQNVQVCQWSVVGSYSAETGTITAVDGAELSLEAVADIIM